MSAARLEAQTELDDLSAAVGQPALKQQIAQRLAEHRARRRGAETTHAETLDAQPVSARSRAAEVAAAVARRYAESPSYRAVLAAESARSVREAEAAAEVANINARAIARAQQELLEQLGDWGSEPAPIQPAHTVPLAGPLPAAEPARAAAAIIAQQLAQKQRAHAMPTFASQPVSQHAAPATAARLESELFGREDAPARAETPSITEISRAGLTVRLFEEVAPPTLPRISRPSTPLVDETEAFLLDEEILFRNDPTFDETRAPEPLPANLIEFPRQLIAARKARPRFAEGPLRDEATDPSQLRIFEVEADSIAVAPIFSATVASAPEWSTILLPAQPATTFFDPLDTSFVPSLVPQTAPLNRRIMAGLLDLTLVSVGTLAATAVFVRTATFLTNQPISAPPLVVAGAAALAFTLFFALYHLLFFTFSTSTPGMRYARIALCTLSDDNPSRAAMRARLAAMFLAVVPLGLGYLWALLDEDRLGWHDRISRMYQRAY